MMENNDILETQENCVYTLYEYFHDHPMILLGCGLSASIMAVCIILDKKSKGVC